jgi:hypothetical protein
MLQQISIRERFLKGKTTYDSTKVVSDLMCDNLPFSEARGRNGCARNYRRRSAGCRLLASKGKINIKIIGRKWRKTYNVASHAIPTSEPVGQPLMRCHRPTPSEPLSPRHCENSDRRSLRSTVLQSTFHGKDWLTGFGHLLHNLRGRLHERRKRAYTSSWI